MCFHIWNIMLQLSPVSSLDSFGKVTTKWLFSVPFYGWNAWLTIYYIWSHWDVYFCIWINKWFRFCCTFSRGPQTGHRFISLFFNKTKYICSVLVSSVQVVGLDARLTFAAPPRFSPHPLFSGNFSLGLFSATFSSVFRVLVPKQQWWGCTGLLRELGPDQQRVGTLWLRGLTFSLTHMMLYILLHDIFTCKWQLPLTQMLPLAANVLISFRPRFKPTNLRSTDRHELLLLS